LHKLQQLLDQGSPTCCPRAPRRPQGAYSSPAGLF